MSTPDAQSPEAEAVKEVKEEVRAEASGSAKEVKAAVQSIKAEFEEEIEAIESDTP